KNGGQVKVGASGVLILRAKTVTVDPTSSIVASGLGDDTRGAGQIGCCNAYYSYSSCGDCGCNRQTCTASPGGSSYGTQGAAAAGSCWRRTRSRAAGRSRRGAAPPPRSAETGG